MRTIRILCAIGIAGLLIGPASADITLTFEEFLGSDGAPLSTWYQGVSFTATIGGSEWVASDVTTGNYNASSWPSGQQWGSGEYWIHDYVGAWTGVVGDSGRISFDNEDATFVQVGYSAATALNLYAYDSSGTLIDSDTQPANLRHSNGNASGPGALRVDAPAGYISYVVLSDAGNFWVMDDLWTDASVTIIPAPGAALLGVIGLGVLGHIKRRLG